MKHISKKKPYKLIAERITHLRKKAGLSQSELAMRMGKDKQWVQRLESGHHDPRISTLCTLAEGLQIPISILVEVD
jgi:transcriptional regulator with XRE-family HTH domain